MRQPALVFLGTHFIVLHLIELEHINAHEEFFSESYFWNAAGYSKVDILFSLGFHGTDFMLVGCYDALLSPTISVITCRSRMLERVLNEVLTDDWFFKSRGFYNRFLLNTKPSQTSMRLWYLCT